MSTDPAIDRACLLELQGGDDSALNRTIARWQKPLLGFAYRYFQNLADAEDLVASAFCRFYQQRMRLRPDTNVSAWLFTTLTNLCHNHHRWKRRHPTVPLDPPSAGEGEPAGGWQHSALADADPTPAGALARDESLLALRRAIDALPPELKATVLLHHYERMSYREIARITGCSERGVETRLYRARRQLRLSLGQYFEQPSPA